MNVKAINEVKLLLNTLKERSILDEWELPYENILSRLSAAIFFVSPTGNEDAGLSLMQQTLEQFPYCSYRPNTEQKLSKLKYRVTFNKEEYEKNANPQVSDKA